MKKITKVLLIAGAVEQKDNLYKRIGLDKLWKKNED